MAGNILYGIKEYSIGAIKILAKVLITICQLLLEIIKKLLYNSIRSVKEQRHRFCASSSFGRAPDS